MPIEGIETALSRAESAHRRFEHLYEISTLFTNFESVEQTLDRVLGIAASTLPLRSAILIETGRSRMIVWSAEGQTSEQMQVAKEHVLTAYTYLNGSGSPAPVALREQAGLTKLPRHAGTGKSREKRFIVTPIVTARRPTFGALQLEGAQDFEEMDLIFANAIANQLAVALDRDGAWRRDITRREQAEERRTDAEARGATAEHARVLAERASEKYEALASENAKLYEKEQQAVRVREQILAVVSHDLRNPLATILLSAADLAAKGTAIPEGLLQNVGRIERSAQRMLRLIEDLLDFASIEAGSFAITRKLEDPGSMILETRGNFERVAEEKQLLLTANIEPNLPKVDCDRDRILQVLSNLVGNATKATAAGGQVSLRVEARGQELLFAVADTGPGISEKDVAHLFERYWRSDAAEYKGTGLGLAIARGIVSAHGGRIWVESEPARGATFFFTVPVAG